MADWTRARISGWRGTFASRGIIVTAILLTVRGLAAQEGAAPTLTGYASAHVPVQVRFEQRLNHIVDTALARRWSRLLSAEPHVAGTPRQRWTALLVDSLTRAWGLSSRIDSFLLYLPHPVSRTLRRERPDPQDLITTEPRLEADPATHGGIFPAFNAYTGRGKAVAEVVYVNYGLIEDYELLDSIGVSVAGKVAVARYGRSFRGIKAREAERHGAVGLILYSDPGDDGYARGDVYPEGPFRPPFGVQRGSILNRSGDPSTPGWASTFEAHRVPEEEMQGIARIPVLPVGYGTAAELLRTLRGSSLPSQGWQGGLPFRYHVGPGPVTAHLTVETERGNAAFHPAYNTIAIVEGSERPDEWVVVGAHRDAWGPGAIDNVSGTVSVIEMARAFAELAQQGMSPKRSIVFATWDAEEWGLIGSFEWVEEHAAELASKVVAYVNQDAVASGPRFGASSAGILKSLIRETMRAVPDPFDEYASVYGRWQGQIRSDSDTTPRIGDLGGGSDFAGFYNHLGIPSANLGFGGSGGVYHSAYDSYTWMSTFGDPEYRAHAGAARAAGTLVARLANADILPYDYIGFAQQLETLANRLKSDLASRGWGTRLDTLHDAIDAFHEAAVNFAAARVAALQGDHAPEWPTINQRLLAVDKQLTRSTGLEGRPWMRNLVFASDRDNGYGNMPLPSVYEAMRDADAERAEAEVADLASRVMQAAVTLREVTAQP